MKASERIATMVHAFDDAERKQAVREIADRVKKLEAVAMLAKGWRWERKCLCHLEDGRKCSACEMKDALSALGEQGGGG